jgi:hypothetical protein
MRLFKSAVSVSGLLRSTNPKLKGANMSIRKSQNFLRAMIIGSLLFALPQGAVAQDQPQSSVKPSTNAKKSKPSADSCDGALDIVPGKPATFIRKRRPSKPETKSEAKPEAKSDAKSDAKPESNPEAKPAVKPEAKPERPDHQ